MNGVARRVAIRAAVALFVLTHVLSARLDAQNWNSPRALELAQRAVARRTSQLSESVLLGYRAKATGSLSFLGQIGDTAVLPPILVQHTQLAVDVFWRAPNQSKQIVVGMRDTLLLPGDVGYYTDRFGIVQSNFADRIRLGDGKDVADVVHPFSAEGLITYDFAVVDSSTYTSGGETVRVTEVAYRPRDPSQPRAVGTAYLDADNADIVRLDVSFTKSALLDPRNESVSVVLENARIDGRVWLPYRQQIEVARTQPGLVIDVHGFVRGRWDVCCYDVQFAAPASTFTGSPISFSALDQMRKYPFEGNILADLPPASRAARPDEIERVQKEAESLVSLAYRDRAERAALAIPSVSDLIRVTRAEGLALGAAGKLHPTAALDFDARARYGFSDQAWKGEVGVSFNLNAGRSVRVFAARDYRDVRDVPEVSGARNTLAAQEFGSDYTDPIDVRSLGAQFTFGRWAHARWRLEAAYDQQAPLRIRATPDNGEYEPLIDARKVEGTRVSLKADGATYSIGGGTLRASAELRVVKYDDNAARLSMNAEYLHPLAGGQLATRTVAAAVTGGALAPQLYVYFGGPTTAPGYAFTDFAARRAVSQRVEWRRDVPFFPIALGRFGQMPAHATLAPFVQAVWVDDPAQVAAINTPPEPTPASLERGDRHGWYPAVGVGFEPLLGTLRFDVARGLRDGRWTFGLDFARSFWPIL